MRRYDGHDHRRRINGVDLEITDVDMDPNIDAVSTLMLVASINVPHQRQKTHARSGWVTFPVISVSKLGHAYQPVQHQRPCRV